MSYSLGQKLCQVDWSGGVPFLKWGTVTKSTKTTYYVDGEKRHSSGWSETARAAFRQEYLSLFQDWDILFGTKRRAPDWTVEDTVRCTVRLRRLERKLLGSKITKRGE
jgi:hypothetical protein